jgi:sugar transferase EpsL
VRPVGRGARRGPAASRAKRGLDLAIAGPALILLSPVLAVLWLVVRREHGRPVLFVQARPGLDGRPFEVHKFRTMTDERDDEGRLLADSQRLTPLGTWLRAHSLDELPQLWDVVRGDLSLVGPRPLLMSYLDRYTPEQARRHLTRPGITGWAQVNGRNATTWPDRLRLDTWYVDHWSLGLDLRILIRTLRQLWSGDGITFPGDSTMPEFDGSSLAEEGSCRRPGS